MKNTITEKQKLQLYKSLALIHYITQYSKTDRTWTQAVKTEETLKQLIKILEDN